MTLEPPLIVTMILTGPCGDKLAYALMIHRTLDRHWSPVPPYAAWIDNAIAEDLRTAIIHNRFLFEEQVHVTNTVEKKRSDIMIELKTTRRGAYDG
jgi:hypothetical protein